ncbi:MAG: glycosyltransferase family 4 protein [Solirubrobacteraceae bacterium]
MRVLIDTSYADRGPSGTAVYLERLVAALRDRGEMEVVEVRQRRRLRPGGGNHLRSAANALLDLVWLHVALPRAARAAGADVVHHPLPAHSRRIDRPQVATLLDVVLELMPEGYGRVWRIIARRAYRRAARRSGALVCISEATRVQAVGMLGADPERTIATPLGPGQELPEVPRPGRARHFLYVGDDHARKNVAGLLEAYAQYRAQVDQPLGLVLAGKAATAARGAGVRGEPGPDARRLAELLATATALVHPSLLEGFGLTLVEAMAAGTPVAAMRNPAAEEVCGAAALLVEPTGLTDALVRLAGDPALRARLSLAGRERAAGFTWAESARLHERAYTLAARGTAAPGANR